MTMHRLRNKPNQFKQVLFIYTMFRINTRQKQSDEKNHNNFNISYKIAQISGYKNACVVQFHCSILVSSFPRCKASSYELSQFASRRSDRYRLFHLLHLLLEYICFSAFDSIYVYSELTFIQIAYQSTGDNMAYLQTP